MSVASLDATSRPRHKKKREETRAPSLKVVDHHAHAGGRAKRPEPLRGGKTKNSPKDQDSDTPTAQSPQEQVTRKWGLWVDRANEPGPGTGKCQRQASSVIDWHAHVL